MIVKVRSDLFSMFELKLFARSTVKEPNCEIKGRSGLRNLLVKKNCPRTFLASHMTLQEAGLLVSPSVFVFKRSEPSPMNQALRRILTGASTSSSRHSQSFVDMPVGHAHAMAHFQDVQKTYHRSSKPDGSEMVCSSSHKTVVSKNARRFLLWQRTFYLRKIQPLPQRVFCFHLLHQLRRLCALRCWTYLLCSQDSQTEARAGCC